MSLKSSQMMVGFMVLGWSVSAMATCIGVGCSCSISATPVAFGNYNPLSSSAVTTTGTISVTCSALVASLNVSYTVTLSQGNSGSYTPRTMTHGIYSLQYNLYLDSLYSSIWGNGSGGTSFLTDSYILNLFSETRNYTVYGRVPGSQNVGTGSYTDSIVATVTF